MFEIGDLIFTFLKLFAFGGVVFTILLLVVGCWCFSNGTGECTVINDNADHCCCHTRPNFEVESGPPNDRWNSRYKWFSIVAAFHLIGQIYIYYTGEFFTARYYIAAVLYLWAWLSFRRQFMAYFNHPSRCPCVCHYTDDFRGVRKITPIWIFFDERLAMPLFVTLALIIGWYILVFLGLITGPIDPVTGESILSIGFGTRFA
ncbi:hypothetical protein F5Y18DRAFT_432818 [Xylariaceae sp. FL1019]|nr:hypothetical protein F5Y18DRAFT_432818 [Xylariaceae sp. FL1019]